MPLAEDVRAQLERVALFAEVDATRLDLFAQRARERMLGVGEALFEEGDPPDALFVLVEGELESFHRVDGDDVPFARHLAPAYLGAIPLLTREPYFGTARALVPARVLAFPGQAFLDLLEVEASLRPVVAQAFMANARAVESAARQRERLSSLGALAAGLAHELNNPTAAARRAARELADAQRREDLALSALDGVALKRLAPLRAEAVARGRAAVERPTGPAATDADPLAGAEREDEVGGWLEARRVPEAWDLAPALAAQGLDPGFLEKVADVAGDRLVAVLAWLAAGADMAGLAATVGRETERVSTLVDAIKDYTYLDQGPEQEVDVCEGIDRTLTVMAGRLADAGVAVEREDRDDLPAITANGSELAQVWTGLLENALWAAGPGGRIAVRTRRSGDRIEVSVDDSGPGVPERLRARVFEPFFTTKAPGEGTGLGLETAWRVVVGVHGGALRVEDSALGGARFVTSLPTG